MEAEGGALPCPFRCPSCGRPAAILYQDTILGGEWHHCEGCQVRGDNFELAARVWSFDRHMTAERLVQLQLLAADDVRDGAVDAYWHWYAARREKTEAFWASCRAHLAQSGRSVQTIRQWLDLAEMSTSTWLSRGGHFLGSADTAMLADYLAPTVQFRGRGLEFRDDEEFVLMPFHDLPGRLSAFLVLDDRRKRFGLYYRHTRSSHRRSGSQYYETPGVFLLEEALRGRRPGEFGDTLFVTTDPVKAAKAQLKHLMLDDQPLPLVGCWPAAPAAPLLASLRRSRPIVLHATDHGPDTFRHAKALDAKISVTGGDVPFSEVLHRNVNVAGWLTMLRRQARPWASVFYRLCRDWSAPTVETVMGKMDLTPHEHRRLVDEAPPAVRGRVGAAGKALRTGTEVVVGRETVVEGPDGWQSVGGDIISEVIVRLDVVVTQRRTGHVWCRGRLLYKGHTVKFAALRADMEKDVLKFAADKVVEAGLGMPRYHWVKDKRRTWDLVTAFSRTETVVTSGVYGWEESTGEFVFPNFVLAKDGSVRDNPSPHMGLKVVPAADLAPPVVVGADELDGLFDEPAAPVAWPVLVFVACNLVSPAFGQPQRGLAAVGPCVSTVVEVAEALGCPRFLRHYAAGGQMGLVTHRLRALEMPGSWPLVVDDTNVGSKQGLHVSYRQWLEDGRKNVITAADEVNGRILFVHGHWHLLDAGRATFGRSGTRALLGRVLVDFLRFAASRRWGHGLWGTCPAERVRDELREYLTARGANAKRLDGVLGSFSYGDRQAAREFGWVLAKMYDGGFLDWSGRGKRLSRQWLARARSPEVPVLVGTRNGTAVWVPQAAVNESLHARRFLAFDVPAVTARLKAAGVLLAEEDVNGEAGWTLTREWWDDAFKAYRSPMKLKLTSG